MEAGLYVFILKNGFRGDLQNQRPEHPSGIFHFSLCKSQDSTLYTMRKNKLGDYFLSGSNELVRLAVIF